MTLIFLLKSAKWPTLPRERTIFLSLSLDSWSVDHRAASLDRSAEKMRLKKLLSGLFEELKNCASASAAQRLCESAHALCVCRASNWRENILFAIFLS